MKILFTLLLATILAIPAFSAQINEIRTDNSGGDTDEYFELAGAPGESLDGLFYIVIGDGEVGSGVMECLVDLSGLSIAADGYLSVHNLGTVGTCATYDVEKTLQFENSDNTTHMLVQGMTAAQYDDLDTDDDGVFDVVPWTSIIDSVAIIETVGEGELVYSDTQVGPDGIYVPGHVLVCGGGWYIGDFDLCVHDTPGEPNTAACALGNEDLNFGDLKARFR